MREAQAELLQPNIAPKAHISGDSWRNRPGPGSSGR